MNDLMTKSFLSDAELKKRGMKAFESEPDIEMGQLDPADERNRTQFLGEVSVIKSEMEEITNLLLDLQDLNEETKSTHSAKVLRGLQDRINSDMVTILRKAKCIKSKLEALDRSNMANRSTSKAYKEGSSSDRTGVSVTNGLRIKLKGMMHDFQSLRDQIVRDHKDCLKKRYYNAIGKEPSEEVIEKMVLEGGQVEIFRGKEDLAMENQERHEAVKEIQRSLTELHQVFLDMAVFVETQGEEINNIEHNVAHAGAFINGGTNELFHANQMKKKRVRWGCWVGILVLVLVLLLVCIIRTRF